MRGWFRLWLVVSILAVPTFAVWQVAELAAGWDKLNKATVARCVDEEFIRKDNPDSLQCARDRGAYMTAFEHEHTTPTIYWSKAFGLGFLVDLIVTGLLAVIVLVLRWIVRGFQIPN